MRTRGKTGNLPKARENASDQVGIGLSAFDLIGWENGESFLHSIEKLLWQK